MAVRFQQRVLPEGVLSIICDDGRDIIHCFAENAPWVAVRRAMNQCVNDYAEGAWRRADDSEKV